VIEKGPVFTLLTLAYPLRGPGGSPKGVLYLSDLLSVERHLEGISLLGKGFIDEREPGLAESAVLVPVGEEGTAGAGIPLRSFGKEIAILKPPGPGQAVSVSPTPWGWERWFLPLSLVAVLFVALGRALRRIDEENLSKMGGGGRPHLSLLFSAALAGTFLLGARLVLLAIDVPGTFFTTPVFSPNLFASGFLDAGSGSIGDFFVSCLFILAWSIWVALRARRLGRERGIIPSLPGRIAGTALAFTIAGGSPSVLLRILRDTSGELLMYGRPMESMAFACWEGALFMLMFSALLLSASFLSLSGAGRKTWPLSLIVSLLSAFLLLALPVVRPEWDAEGIMRVLSPVAFISASLLLSGLPTNRLIVLRGTGFLAFGLAGILMTSLLIFPIVLWKKYRVLVENAEDLYGVAEKPIDTWVTFLLEEFIQSVETRREEIKDQLSSRESAFALWAQSPLSRAGASSALSIYGQEGKSLAAFSLLADPLPEDLAKLLWQEVMKRRESFIYTCFVAGEEYYVATIPLEGESGIAGMVTARLPTGLGRRIERGAAPFLMSQGDLPARSRMSFSLLGEEARTIWKARGVEEGEAWVRVEPVPDSGRNALVSLRYIASEGRWLLVEIPLAGRGVLFGMLVATILLNIISCVPPFLALFLFPERDWRGKRRGRPALFGSFRARLSLALFFFSLVPTLIWGLLARGAIVDRIGRETQAEAQRILRDASLLFNEEEGSLETPLFPADERVGDLAGMIGAELFLYSGHMLVSSSRPDLVQSGILIPWISPRAYRALFLEGEENAADFLILGHDQYLMVYRRFTGVQSQAALVLATPMLLRQEEIREEVIELDYLLLIAVMSVLGASVLMGTLVAFFLTKPLGELVKGTSRLASGEFDCQLEEKRSDEFGELFESFNAMARKLKTSHLLLLSEKAKLEGILKNVGAGVIVLNDRRQVVLQNDAASRIIGEDLSSLPGEDLPASRIARGPWREFAAWAVDHASSGEMQFTVHGARGEMSVRTAKTTARLADDETLSVVIFEDVTESVRSQRILAWALMARQIAHEIKNPLTPIRLAVQHIRRLFRDRSPDFEKRLEENVALVLREIDRLGRTASQFSSFAKAESAQTVPLDPARIIEETIALYRGDESGKKIFFEGGKERRLVLADEEGFRRILVNLVENSRDAISEDGSVSISLEDRDGWVVLSVSDTGEGIPPEMIDRVFEPDFTTRTNGTGLGLTIVKRITEAWGGRVELESAPGKGTRVRIFMRRA
jgi:signal transduction histidine kinase/HAMP domain-containing protein